MLIIVKAFRRPPTGCGRARETFNVAIYSLVGLYKIIFITFNLIPYVALLIVGKKNV